MERAVVLATLLSVASVAGAGIQALEVEAVVDPAAGTIMSTATLTVVPDAGAESIEALLNRRLELTAVEADVGLAGFTHEKHGDGPYRYAPQATPLRVHLAQPATGEPVRVRLVTRGAVEPDAFGVIQVHQGWVELVAAYSGWVPFDGSGSPYDLRLQVELPDGWTAVGTGGLRLEDGVWRSAVDDAPDTVLIAAPELRRLDVGGDLSIRHVDLPAQTAERIAEAARQVRRTLAAWFGPAAGDRVEVVFAPRESGGGYARPGLVVMLYDAGPEADPGRDAGFLRYLAHEVSHLWWRGASTTDWEDWLNESFAEMTALMVLRERLGDEVFARWLERYREVAAGLPAVRGIERGDERAFEVLYRKGPVLLAELEAEVGREAFLRFLRARLDGRPHTTGACLEALGEVVSPEARQWLEAALGR